MTATTSPKLRFTLYAGINNYTMNQIGPTIKDDLNSYKLNDDIFEIKNFERILASVIGGLKTLADLEERKLFQLYLRTVSNFSAIDLSTGNHENIANNLTEYLYNNDGREICAHVYIGGKWYMLDKEVNKIVNSSSSPTNDIVLTDEEREKGLDIFLFRQCEIKFKIARTLVPDLLEISQNPFNEKLFSIGNVHDQIKELYEQNQFNLSHYFVLPNNNQIFSNVAEQSYKTSNILQSLLNVTPSDLKDVTKEIPGTYGNLNITDDKLYVGISAQSWITAEAQDSNKETETETLTFLSDISNLTPALLRTTSQTDRIVDELHAFNKTLFSRANLRDDTAVQHVEILGIQAINEALYLDEIQAKLENFIKTNSNDQTQIQKLKNELSIMAPATSNNKKDFEKFLNHLEAERLLFHHLKNKKFQGDNQEMYMKQLDSRCQTGDMRTSFEAVFCSISTTDCKKSLKNIIMNYIGSSDKIETMKPFDYQRKEYQGLAIYNILNASAKFARIVMTNVALLKKKTYY